MACAVTIESADEQWGRAFRENRVVRVQLSERVLVDYLTCARSPRREFVRIPVIKEIPNDARMLRVQSNFLSGQIEAVLLHPSFDAVPPGCEIKLVGPYDQEFEIHLTADQSAKVRQMFNEEDPSANISERRKSDVAIRLDRSTVIEDDLSGFSQSTPTKPVRKKIPHEFLGPPR
jgi:hypothetical protein